MQIAKLISHKSVQHTKFQLVLNGWNLSKICINYTKNEFQIKQSNQPLYFLHVAVTKSDDIPGKSYFKLTKRI